MLLGTEGKQIEIIHRLLCAWLCSKQYNVILYRKVTLASMCMKNYANQSKRASREIYTILFSYVF